MRTQHSLSCMLIFGLISTAVGCSHRGPNPDTLKLLRAAGDQASLTIVVQPARFAAATQTLRPLLQGIQEPGVRQVLAAEDLWSTACAIANVVPVPKKPKLPETLTGWDQTRPIVAALFEPQVGDLVLAARSVLPMSMRQILDTGLPGVRHRILVPATDPQVLTQSVAKIFGQVGLKAFVADRVDPALKGGFLFLPPGGDGFAALIPEQDHLRIELLTGDHTPAKDDAARVAAWSTLLARPVQSRASGNPSPALRLAASGVHLAAFHVRPWQLRDLGSQIGTRQLVEAMTQVSTDMRMQLMAVGLAAVANGYLMMDRDRPEFDDLCVAFDLTGGLRTTAVVSLTEHGAKVFRAGLEQGRPPPAPKGEPLAWAWSRLDLNAMLQTAGTLPSLSKAEKPREIMQALQECGPFCSLHFLATNPFGAARTAVDFAPVDLSNKLPRGFSLALVGFSVQQEAAIRAVVAGRFPAGFNTRPIREGIAGISRRVPAASGLVLDSESVAGDELVTLRLGLQPGEGLDGQVDAPDGVLGQARVDLAKLIQAYAPIIGRRDAQLAESLGLLGTWRSRSVLVDRAVVGESLLSLKQGEKELAWIRPAAFDGVDWDAGAPGAPTQGERCLQRVTRSMMEGFRALAMVAPEQRNLMLAKAVQETDTPLACALGETDTAERAKRTQLMIHLFLADRMAEDFNDEGEREVLGKACKLGHPEACQRAEAIGGRPRIALAQVKGSCGPGVGWGQPALRIKTAADAETQIAGCSAEPGTPMPNLAPDAGARWSVISGALKALAEKGIDRIGLVVRQPTGGVQTIEVARPGAKPKADPYDGPRFARLAEPDARNNEISLLLEAKKVLLMDEDGTYYLDHRQDCKPGEVCADLEGLGLEYKRLARGLAPGAKLRVQIEPQVPFRDAAAVLGLISCAEPKHRWGGALAREIVIGPLPAGTVDRTKARKLTAQEPKLTAQEPKQRGILALLGAKTEGGGAIGPLNADGRFGGLGSDRGSKGPHPRVRTGLPVIMGSLSKEIIHRIIRRQYAQIRYCYEKQLVHTPDLQGKVVVKFVISPTGAVQSTQVTKTTLEDEKVEACLVEAFKRMLFPEPKGGGIVIVTYPLTFAADRAGKDAK